jgi:murein DD-endopeptidase MepM/ murein hydrolase activator NlpD
VKRIFIVLLTVLLFAPSVSGAEKHIKWVDFTPSCAALSDALALDLSAHERGESLKWTQLLAVYSAKNGGLYKSYKKSAMEAIAQRLLAGEDPATVSGNAKLYNYYSEAYEAALGGFVGTYYAEARDGTVTQGYGLRVFHPIAAGYYYRHYDDFGASRSYGYRREHLGHDLISNIGTPVVAVEAGWVEAAGWNRFGGWRIGIRSYDGKRYWYYAHLRKGHPYNDIYEGKQVAAGEVIGYVGRTGYSSKKDVNNIDTPHLHFGLQLIFAPEQKDGYNQIWLDMYALTQFLEKKRMRTYKADGEAYSEISIYTPETPD